MCQALLQNRNTQPHKDIGIPQLRNCLVDLYKTDYQHTATLLHFSGNSASLLCLSCKIRITVRPCGRVFPIQAPKMVEISEERPTLSVPVSTIYIWTVFSFLNIDSPHSGLVEGGILHTNNNHSGGNFPLSFPYSKS